MYSDGKLQVWEKYLKDSAAGQTLNQDAFIATLKKQVQDPAVKQTLAGPLPLFFSAIDANADGMIQKEEFELFFDIIGLDPKMAGDTFEASDDVLQYTRRYTPARPKTVGHPSQY